MDIFCRTTVYRKVLYRKWFYKDTLVLGNPLIACGRPAVGYPRYVRFPGINIHLDIIDLDRPKMTNHWEQTAYGETKSCATAFCCSNCVQMP